MIRSKTAAAIQAGVFFGLLAWGFAAGAQVYKWVDEKGTIHFSDAPPTRLQGTAPVQVIPEEDRVPMVENGPPPPSDSEPPPDEEDLYEPEGGGIAEGLGSDADSPSVVVVDGGARDPAVRFRARSPLNRPGQPVRPRLQSPVQQPRHRHRAADSEPGPAGSDRRWSAHAGRRSGTSSRP